MPARFAHALVIGADQHVDEDLLHDLPRSRLIQAKPAGEPIKATGAAIPSRLARPLAHSRPYRGWCARDGPRAQLGEQRYVSGVLADGLLLDFSTSSPLGAQIHQQSLEVDDLPRGRLPEQVYGFVSAHASTPATAA
ncbi:hypothetical protein MKK88_19080 [Methylobacterium sp. E-005]|uniref:hypothetical protein n=1 Tax=Methylobacterium sp. E-005 TaxID=2836549 RepID=UPI001FB8FD55|nr:hypothetical protein [Methylobacterium sp. E-005]MCJ2088069.1 hypothetical protein [Methylobacterium sp. E-005]